MLLIRPGGARCRTCSVCRVLQRHLASGAEPGHNALKSSSPHLLRKRNGVEGGRDPGQASAGAQPLRAPDARVLQLTVHHAGHAPSLAVPSTCRNTAMDGSTDGSTWASQVQDFESALRAHAEHHPAVDLPANAAVPPLDLQAAAVGLPVPSVHGPSSSSSAREPDNRSPRKAGASKKKVKNSEQQAAAPRPGKSGRQSVVALAKQSWPAAPAEHLSEEDRTLEIRFAHDKDLVAADELDLPVTSDGGGAHVAAPAKAGKLAQKKVGAAPAPCHGAVEDKAQMQAKIRPTSFGHELLSYVDMCIYCGWVDRAHSAVSFYAYSVRRSAIRRLYRPTDVAVFNRVLQAWAHQGNVTMVKDVLDVMEECNVRPNALSFAYAALAEAKRARGNPSNDAVRCLEADMRSKGFTIQDIVALPGLLEEERFLVLNALHVIDPSLSFKETKVLDYDNVLVNHLNVAPSDIHQTKNPFAGVLTPAEQAQSLAEQIQLELSGSATVDSVAQITYSANDDADQTATLPMDKMPSRILMMRQILEKVKDQWRTTLKASFGMLLKSEQKKQESSLEMCLYPYLAVLPEDVYIDIILKEVANMAVFAETHSPGIAELSRKVGNQVYRLFMGQRKQKLRLHEKLNDSYSKYMESFFSDQHLPSLRKAWHEISADSDLLVSHEVPWPYSIIVKIGLTLYDLILSDVKIDPNILAGGTSSLVPAFYVIYRKKERTKHLNREVKPHPLLVRLYSEAQLRELLFEDTALPMLVPPTPWTSSGAGGYLFSNVGLVRRLLQGSTTCKMSGPARGEEQQVLPILEGLNVVSACPWRVNKPILDALLEVFNSGGNEKLEISRPASACTLPPQITQGMTNQEKAVANRQRLKLRQQCAEAHSLWCTQLYKFSLAKKYSDRIFWLPHNLDFRGRAYPCPPHFSHVGDDVSRSLMHFAHRKKLGPKGLDWLKIHLINLTGLRKRSTLDGRLAYANECMDEVFDSAQRPMDGRRWWQESGEPWQTLACCQEIVRALESGDPSQFMSSFPVHQDGSCNGLQHYASLGRDQLGAESVNVAPASAPQDVYAEVANMIEKERQKDAAAGNKAAAVLDGFITRKVIKQTVMTTVYGVTQYGARAQIHRQLTDLKDFPQKFSFQASNYLTEKTFHCLQQMFTSTKEIQDWLTMCAYTISNECEEQVTWATPVGLQVVQPYMKLQAQTNVEIPNAAKQKNAFAPNFIHSLDSAHMILTALHCYQQGITFVSVHDCFWTHACDVDAMNKICREQFAAMYNQPILENLAEYMKEKYASKNQFLKRVLDCLPSRGTFDVSSVKDSQYFFS